MLKNGNTSELINQLYGYEVIIPDLFKHISNNKAHIYYVLQGPLHDPYQYHIVSTGFRIKKILKTYQDEYISLYMSKELSDREGFLESILDSQKSQALDLIENLGKEVFVKPEYFILNENLNYSQNSFLGNFIIFAENQNTIFPLSGTVYDLIGLSHIIFNYENHINIINNLNTIVGYGMEKVRQSFNMEGKRINYNTIDILGIGNISIIQENDGNITLKYIDSFDPIRNSDNYTGLKILFMYQKFILYFESIKDNNSNIDIIEIFIRIVRDTYKELEEFLKSKTGNSNFNRNTISDINDERLENDLYAIRKMEYLKYDIGMYGFVQQGLNFIKLFR